MSFAHDTECNVNIQVITPPLDLHAAARKPRERTRDDWSESDYNSPRSAATMGFIRGAIIESLLGALGAAGLLLGFILIYLARRGRRIDDHPHCRGCGYDLTGRPMSSDRCAECGADLTRRRAVRVGNRVPRRQLIWAGVSFITLLLMLTGAMVWVQMSSANLMKYKPVWLLRSDASSLLSNKRVPAVTELTRRFTAGELTDAQIQAIVSDAIVFQANPNFPWKEWDGLVNSILLAGKIGDEDWVTLVRQAVRLHLLARRQVRAGDPMPITLICTIESLAWWIPGVSYSRMRPPPPIVEFKYLDAEISGVKATNVPSQENKYPSLLGTTPIEGLVISESQTTGLTTGVHRVACRISVSVLSQKSKEKLANFVVPVYADVTILPANTDPKLLFVTEPAVTDAMLKATWSVELTAVSGWAAREMYVLNMGLGNAPAGLAHQAYLRTPDGREIAVGSVALRSGSAITGSGRGFGAAIGHPGVVDLVLRPDFELVKQSVRSDPIWGEEIFFHDLKVMPQRSFRLSGGQRPTTIPRRGE